MANKTCKVYPRNGLQYIPGILEKRERIEFPAQLPLSEKELRRCLSFADVYEVTDAGDVLLTLDNYLEDNSKATPATDVPEVELLYPRGGALEGDEEEEEEDPVAEAAKQEQSAVQAKKTVAAAQVKATEKKDVVSNQAQTTNINNKANQYKFNQETAKKENTNEASK